MKDLRPTRGAVALGKMIAEGEHEHQDFKYTISDARKIARSLSAFANNDGGRLLIGVKDNGTVAGVRNEEDIYVVEQAARLYCRPALEVDFRAIKAKGGHEVIVAEVKRSEFRPVLASDESGHWRAYYRVADENIVAHPLMVEVWEAGRTASATSLTDLHRAVIAAVEEKARELDLLGLAVAVHASTASVRRAVAELAAAGLLAFGHEDGHFILIVPEEK